MTCGSENETSEARNDLDIVDCTRLFFESDGALTRAIDYGGPAYESRPQQQSMAKLVAEAFDSGVNLCVEAPTGVGKSFAYLVPAIYFAVSNDRPVVVSTETIPLQEQLVNKDLPLLSKLVDAEFSFALAKGRTNYICRRRLAWITSDSGSDYLPLPALEPQARALLDRVDELEVGDRSELESEIDARVWNGVCCETGNCHGPKCRFYRRCFYWRARREWERADVIVANHALLFTDLKMKMEDASAPAALLPPYGALVFDEAHLLEDSAASHLGLRISELGSQFLLNKLFDPRNARGLLMRGGKDIAELRKLVAEAHDAATLFFSAFADRLVAARKDELRFEKPGMVVDNFSPALGMVESALEKLLKSGELDEDTELEAGALFQRVAGMRSEVFDFVNMELEEHVYWAERCGRDRNKTALVAAPLNVAELLRAQLFSEGFPVILTSATLSVEGNLGYFKSRVGFVNGPEVVLDSPFDYARQAELHLVRGMPDQNEDGYIDAISEHIRFFVEHTNGKAFVLFTNFASMRGVAEKLRGYFLDKGITMHVQGDGVSRAKMISEFKKDINSVIFGVSSFWMGVDIPGEALSNVIITKLPFSVPTHPLTKARGEKLEKDGKSSFIHYQLPETVLKLKQGVGRLIRNATDKGIIVILDSRVLTKSYGRKFIDSIPKCPTTIHKAR